MLQVEVPQNYTRAYYSSKTKKYHSYDNTNTYNMQSEYNASGPPFYLIVRPLLSQSSAGCPFSMSASCKNGAIFSL